MTRGFIILLATFLPTSSIADDLGDPSLWFETTQICQRIISEQTTDALEDYELLAPSAIHRLQGIDETSAYVANDLMIVNARRNETGWYQCVVRARDEVRSLEQRPEARALARDWVDDFPSRYPVSEYSHVKFRHPARLAPGAVSCAGEDIQFLVFASLESDFQFRVFVTDASETSGANLCKRQNS